MKLVLADVGYLKDSISVISDLVNEARFKITKDAIELIAMDPANVAMVVFKLLSSCFVEYQIEQEQEIGINLANLKQILRRASASDILSLEVTEDNKLKIQLKSKTTRTFSLPIIDLEEREQKVPNLDFHVTVTLPSAIFNDAIADADIVAESVMFHAEPDKFDVHAEGDLSRASIEMKKSDVITINVGTSAKVKAKYSIEYLKKMISASKLASEVIVQFNQDYPLKLDYKVQDRLMLSFILAPRVDND
jgi:proliferating cell nuclear antigen